VRSFSFDFPSWYGVCPVLIRCLFLFRFAGLLRSNFNANSMTLASSTLQIRIHDYAEHLKFVISIIVNLFADSSLLVFSKIEYVIALIDVFPINLNEYCCF
jgi:hypothetical protein